MREGRVGGVGRRDRLKLGLALKEGRGGSDGRPLGGPGTLKLGTGGRPVGKPDGRLKLGAAGRLKLGRAGRLKLGSAGLLGLAGASWATAMLGGVSENQ